MTDKEARELNELVAQKLGWVFNTETYQYWIPPNLFAQDKYGNRPSSVPNYVGDIKACWEIVQNVALAFALIRNKTGEWKAGFVIPKESVPNEEFCAEADTAQEAIVGAFLKLPEKG